MKNQTMKLAGVALTAVPPPLALTVTTTKYEPGRISLSLSAPAPAGSALVVSENFYPGWVATVDGKPADVERTNLVLIGVPLPEGAKSVELTFTSPTFERGKTITIAALLVSLLAIIVGLVPFGPAGGGRAAGAAGAAAMEKAA